VAIAANAAALAAPTGAPESNDVVWEVPTGGDVDAPATTSVLLPAGGAIAVVGVLLMAAWWRFTKSRGYVRSSGAELWAGDVELVDDEAEDDYGGEDFDADSVQASEPLHLVADDSTNYALRPGPGNRKTLPPSQQEPDFD